MSIAPGVRFGPYEIVGPLGSGGMGEVYRARDTRLDRMVAIKVLPSQFAADPQLRERFDREARAISSLQHPHICALFDVGREDDTSFLVLECLEGETLADRLARDGALPVADALAIAIQICGALDSAHRSGIVHRDLKPANVMLVRGGGSSAPPTAKLLDFGLAKAAAPIVATSGPSMLPTTPPNVTAQGTILGTFQYMAPEQIEGLEADARTDIFAFGALLFEMLSGRTAFEGKTRASLIGAILKDEPPPVSLALSAERAEGPKGEAGAPGSTRSPRAEILDRIVATCLAKDPDDRYQSARDLLRDLKWAASADAAAAPSAGAAPRPRVGRMVLAALVLLLLGTVASALLLRQMRPLTGTEPIQFTVPAPDKNAFGGPAGGGTGQATELALSADGRQLAFVAGDELNVYRLWIRSAGSIAPRVVAGTEGAAFPFWSPDGRHVGFFADGSLKKAAIVGGAPITLCAAPNARGGTWSRDNVILFGATTSTLQRVSASGGIPSPASAFDAAYGETSHRWPHFLPDGRHFLYTASIGVCCPPSKPAAIRIGSLDSPATSTLFQMESAVTYASGHLLYLSRSTLMAQPFDASARRFIGDPFPVVEAVNTEGSRYASVSASETGVLAYAHGGGNVNNRLVWRDRAGNMAGNVGEPALYLGMALSRDDRQIAVVLPSGSIEDRDIWIIDTLRGTRSRLTFEPGPDITPVWSPDGTRIAFQGVRNGEVGMRQKIVSGTAADEPLMRERMVGLPTDWSADGRFIAFNRVAGSGRSVDVWVLPTFGDRKPFPFVETQFDELSGTFSPDGRWLAYASTETGQSQIYVQPFPATGGRYQVSRNGGVIPTWRSDGKELFYLAPPDSRLTAVSIDTSRGFEMGEPQALFVTNAAPNQATYRQFAISNDGKRFLINTQVQQASTQPITVVVNWLSSVQK
jgi:Tol biopolymer transport system component